jgi:pyridoxamine 5'-phosphate oxidase
VSGDADRGPASLDEARANAFALLSRAVADRRSPMHVLALGTTGLDGRPRLRSVVLRAFDPAQRTLRFHTDLRSAKVAELRRDPRLALLAYDPGHRVQIRIESAAMLHHADAVAAAAWAASQPMSRQCYGTQPGPGTPIADGDAFQLPLSEPEFEAGQAQFVAVVCPITTLDWLHLAHSGHRRAHFDWSRGAGGPAGRWLVP